jgi:hypothetical protein
MVGGKKKPETRKKENRAILSRTTRLLYQGRSPKLGDLFKLIALDVCMVCRRAFSKIDRSCVHRHILGHDQGRNHSHAGAVH